MPTNDLLSHLSQFLATRPVKKLCRSYRTDPGDALGELYFRLVKLAVGKQIENPANWIFINGMGVLRNWLRREVRTLV